VPSPGGGRHLQHHLVVAAGDVEGEERAALALVPDELLDELDGVLARREAQDQTVIGPLAVPKAFGHRPGLGQPRLRAFEIQGGSQPIRPRNLARSWSFGCLQRERGADPAGLPRRPPGGEQ
jgi:hypothetical protein